MKIAESASIAVIQFGFCCFH